jgi:carboxyl-terminal processing protease
MVDALGDEHSSYMDPDQTQRLNTVLEGEYEGIGAEVDPTAEYLTIVTPFPNSPAEKAGLRPGDQVIAVDGDDMTGIDGNLVVRRVLGPAGSKVVLTILREGTPEPFDVEITRAKIVMPTLESRMLDGNIAYVRLYGFGEKSASDLRNALEDLLAQEPVGLIFDLRNNGGGLLSAAVDVSSEFLEDKVVVIQEFGDGSRETLSTNGRGVATEIPLVVLVNEGSASASEIVAGAIQDYGRGQLVGMTTYGKGSVQLPLELRDDQGIVRVTIARWLTPNERQIHQAGLEPDVPVELTVEDFDAGRDPQLDKAVELLSTP